ncbi:tRNA (adenosine(37)-N6)-threonylcarbamoyltransferase complex dimerization subunit type 1 TsaB [Nitrospina watsonii]|uniref:Inactive homolog of metal-dependent proteases, molecular chaperone n=1 Tax=Nitrospina watsonii TaxID=1323948 RepID=A0ABN8W5S8_9BACT|nr:tRNA (adenosine(37)-N6)-threonylcarbamoyltransferase complex dimerization subunit type 1 TsaB [Nitrospina watsonii]CAI2718728.1 putative Inactive homolog of metal-dependent proteases, molecular chaperone [Nitrospina watsonii]
MRILAIDSSTPQCSVALFQQNPTLLQQFTAEDQPAYSNRLLEWMNRILDEAGVRLDEVDGFAVTTGPGSFTGLRVGLSLIKGFVLATEKPFVGVTTFDAWTATLQTEVNAFCPVLDARKQQVYAARFHRERNQWTRQMEDRVLAPEALCDLIDRPTLFAGSGLAAYAGLFRQRLGDRFLTDTTAQTCNVAAGAALWAASRFDDAKQYDLNSLRIDYIRKSEAELNFKG